MQRFLVAIFADQPARAFRRAPHANKEADSGNGLYQQHIAPDVRQMAPDDANDRVDGKRRQLANDDGDFIQAGQLTAHLGRRHFRNKSGGSDRRAADGVAQQGAGNQQGGDIGSCGGKQGADKKNKREEE